MGFGGGGRIDSLEFRGRSGADEGHVARSRLSLF